MSSVSGRARPLPHDAVFRIEVSLSSRKSSAIVMRTTARLYSLEGSQEMQGGAGDAEWKSVAYGAPCIQLTKETTEHNSPFSIKIVIAEVESGISLWETGVDAASGYHMMQNNFHTFKSNGKTYAIQFASEDEAGRMLESLEDLLLQKEKAETVSFDTKSEDAVFKKPKPFSRRLSKKDISAPCNFKHVSGITMQRTQTCEEELRGTIQRKMRSMSLSSLNRKVKSRPRLSSELMNGTVYSDQDQPVLRQSPDIPRREKGREGEGRKGSKHKFGSLRKKKGGKQGGGVTVTILDYPAGSEEAFVRDEHRRSLPSHFRHQTRQPISADTFVPPEHRPSNDSRAPNRALSLSSGDLVDVPDTSGSSRQPLPLERRHTMNEHRNRPSVRPFTQFSYTPYSVAQAQSIPEGTQLSNRQYMSDMSLNRMPSNNVGGRMGMTMEPGSMERGSEHGRQGRQGRMPQRNSMTEAQLNGRVDWQERGLSAEHPGARGGRQTAQGTSLQRTNSRSTGSINGPDIPPPLPPPNNLRTSKTAVVPTNVPPQYTAQNAPSQPPVGSGPPAHSSAEGSGDPEPYATIGYKRKSRNQPKNLPPSEYDLLTPRQQKSSHDSQPQNQPSQPQGMAQHPSTMVPPQAQVYYPPTHGHVRPAQPGLDTQRHSQGVPPQHRQYLATVQQDHPRVLSHFSHQKAYPQTQSSPHHSTVMGSRPPPVPGELQYRQPQTYTHPRAGVPYTSQVPSNVPYPVHSSYPALSSASVPYPATYPGHMTTGLLHPQQQTWTQVAPSSPSHPNTQISPAPTVFHSQGYSVTGTAQAHLQPSATRERPLWQDSDPIRPDQKEHYDNLMPHTSSETGTGASPATSHSSALGELQGYTDQMSRALEQFDSLLAPQPKKQITQTSL